MPKLLVFAPCEKVIVSEGDGASSLISIVQGFTAEAPLPSGNNLALPLVWYIYALWENTGDGNGTQLVELLPPSGPPKLAIQAEVTTEPGRRFFRAVTRVTGLPIGGAGDHVLRLSFRADGEESYRELARFPIPFEAPSA
jgi:hypothetical protein